MTEGISTEISIMCFKGVLFYVVNFSIWPSIAVDDFAPFSFLYESIGKEKGRANPCGFGLLNIRKTEP